MKRVIFFLFLCLAQICYPQGLIYNPVINTSITNNIVTPELNTLLRYQDFPNINFIGGSNIDIPIYEVKYDDLLIPISLSYNTKGSKVSDIASDVGLGWTLNAGGSVSIDINEKYDFSASFKHVSNGMFGDLTVAAGSGIYGREYKPNTYKIPPYLNYQIDIAPDYYFVSAPGLNDKFYLSKIDNFYELISLNDFRTSLNKNINEVNDFDNNTREFYYNAEINYIPKKFDIKNGNGYLYSFENRVLVRNINERLQFQQLILNRPSSWYLSSIHSPHNKKDIVNFYYDNFENRYKHISVQSFQKINVGSVIISKIINSDGRLQDPETVAQYSPSLQIDENIFDNSQRLSKIDFPGGSISFIYGEKRLDYDGQVLSKIIIKNSLNKEIKHLDFFYSYFKPIDTNCSGVYNCLRLKLDRIYDSSLESSYDFTYGGQQLNDNLFPSRGSQKVDFLGYYNGNNSTNDFGCESYCFLGEADPFNHFVNGTNIKLTNKVYFYPNLTRDYFLPFKLSNYIEESITGVYDGSSNTKSLLGLLTTIRYPTKGSLRIEYENDDFEYMGANYLLGSSRIKNMEYLDSNNERVRKINFSYKKEDKNSSGEIKFLIPPTDILRGNINTGYKNSAIIGYSRIIQEELGNGKTEKYYSNFSSYPDIKENIDPAPSTIEQKNFFKFFNYPGTFIQNMDLRRGNLIKEIFYNDNNKLKENTFEYSYFEKNSFETKKLVFEHTNGGLSTNIYNAKNRFITYQNYLDKKTTEEFYNGNIIKNVDEYNYNKHKNLLIEHTIFSSKNDTLTTEYQYPSDLVSGYEQSSLMEEMTDKNMIANPIITTSKNGKTVLSEQRILYQLFPGVNENLILPKYVYSKKGEKTTVADRKITYNSYDIKGNLTQYTPENGIPVSIIWGYNGQYPIAKIEGSTNTELSNYIQLVEQNIKSNNDTYKLIFAKIRENFPNSMITNYLYQPLIGVTEIIHPNGQTEYYNYDAANRLQSIVNDKQEVLKTFQYNYKQP
ncbi:hypothetical protein [Empedobacter tilapiae]|uniref:hypothetical protein n=1 Tax=Empedobacter tilapiae TaxID=2491114 RepID=UPI0028D59D06|nr:hypothetical protein [Empedobacter tilapiae]